MSVPPQKRVISEGSLYACLYTCMWMYMHLNLVVQTEWPLFKMLGPRTFWMTSDFGAFADIQQDILMILSYLGKSLMFHMVLIHIAQREFCPLFLGGFTCTHTWYLEHFICCTFRFGMLPYIIFISSVHNCGTQEDKLKV